MIAIAKSAENDRGTRRINEGPEWLTNCDAHEISFSQPPESWPCPVSRFRRTLISRKLLSPPKTPHLPRSKIQIEFRDPRERKDLLSEDNQTCEPDRVCIRTGYTHLAELVENIEFPNHDLAVSSCSSNREEDLSRFRSGPPRVNGVRGSLHKCSAVIRPVIQTIRLWN